LNRCLKYTGTEIHVCSCLLMAGSFYMLYYFIFFFMFCLFLLFRYCLIVVKLLIVTFFNFVVLLGVFFFLVGLLNFSISSFPHRMMLHFCGYHLGCAGCASGSWSNLMRLICRDHLWIVCLGSFRDCMCYSIACCSHSYQMICFVGVEDHIGSVGFVFYNFLVLIVEHF
jgi:hypothetical protein